MYNAIEGRGERKKGGVLPLYNCNCNERTKERKHQRLTTVDWESSERKTEILLEMTVKVFIGYILLELDLKDSKALARRKKPSVLVDNNFSRRLKLNSGT